MISIQMVGPGDVRSVEAEIPIAQPGEALVSVRAVGVCGSDIHGVSAGLYPAPVIIGHEFAGLSVDGRRVAVNPQVACGQCANCSVGVRHLCSSNTIIGIARPGGMAEFVAVPEDRVVELPARTSWKAGAMVEVVATALHAINRAGGGADRRVGVIGAGPVGLCAALCAQAQGAASVAMTDRLESREQVVTSLGIDWQAGQLASESFDVVIEAAGVQATQAGSLAALVPGGTAVWVGIHDPDVHMPYATYSIVVAERAVMGSFAYTDDEFRTAAQLCADWDFSWVSEFPLDNTAPEVFRGLANGTSEIVKAHFVLTE